MPRLLPGLILCWLVCVGCHPTPHSRTDAIVEATARAAVAFAEAETQRSQSPATPIENDSEPTTVPATPRRRLLYFTATWCAACRANEPALAALSRRGWRIGPDETAHIQTIDLDARPDLRSRHAVTAVPAWVLLDGDHEVRRRYGTLDPFAIGRLFETRD